MDLCGHCVATGWRGAPPWRRRGLPPLPMRRHAGAPRALSPGRASPHPSTHPAQTPAPHRRPIHIPPLLTRTGAALAPRTGRSGPAWRVNERRVDLVRSPFSRLEPPWSLARGEPWRREVEGRPVRTPSVRASARCYERTSGRDSENEHVVFFGRALFHFSFGGPAHTVARPS